MAEVKGITFTPPMDYLSLIEIMKSSYLIWTDSGGIQEEAPSFKKPVIILREVTERPEVVTAGFGELTGTNTSLILESTRKLLDDELYYQSRVSGKNPFGDGDACEQIIEILKLR